MSVSRQLAGIPLVDVLRGGRVESTHDVAAYACDDAGTILLEVGTVDVPVFCVPPPSRSFGRIVGEIRARTVR
jgi:L-asparaginase II